MGLHRLQSDRDFNYLDLRMLVSCPSDVECPGGLFLLDFQQNSLQKLFDGDCRGIVKLGDRLLVSTDSHGILVFDRQFELIHSSGLISRDLHGMCIFSEDVVLVVETSINAIGCYHAETLNRMGEIRFNQANYNVHHLNDICVEGTKLYVSMFSPDIAWRDYPAANRGCIVELDLSDYDPDAILEVDPEEHLRIKGLAMPYSVIAKDGKLSFCESMALRIVIGDDETVQFQGFARGLAFHQDFALVGQSYMRHFSRIAARSANFSVECGIHIYKTGKRISRFVPLPANQIYQLMLLDF